DLLKRYAWPGNVRELRNVVERMVILAKGAAIGPADLPEDLRGVAPKTNGSEPGSASGDLLSLPTLREARAAFERELLQRKLAEFGGNVSRTAEAIGLER